MNVTSVTPILFTEAIEPSLPFWTDGLGFRVTTEVPTGDHLGFVILQREREGGGAPLEVMLQTRESVRDDLPVLEPEVMRGPATLFLQVEGVEDVDDAEKALARLGGQLVVPRRQTFYGAHEIFVRSPEGAIVGLAAFPEGQETGEGG